MSPRLLPRYLMASLSRYFCFTLLVLLVIFSGLEMTHVLSDWFEHHFPAVWLFYSVALEWPFLLVLLLPLSYYLSVLCVFGAWTEQKEWLAMRVLGYRIQRFYLWVLLPALLLSLVVGLCAFVVQPRVLQEKNVMYKKIALESAIHWVRPHYFNRLGSDWVIYPEGKDPKTHQLHGVFAASSSAQSLPMGLAGDKQKKWYVLLSDTADLLVDHGHFDLVFKQGQLYLGNPGTADFRLIHFKRYVLQWQTPTQPDHLHDEADQHATDYLIAHYRHGGNFSALFWRVSMSVAPLLLTLFALSSLSLFLRRYTLACAAHAVVVVVYMIGLVTVKHALQAKAYIDVAAWVLALLPHGFLLMCTLCLWRFERYTANQHARRSVVFNL